MEFFVTNHHEYYNFALQRVLQSKQFIFDTPVAFFCQVRISHLIAEYHIVLELLLAKEPCCYGTVEKYLPSGPPVLPAPFLAVGLQGIWLPPPQKFPHRRPSCTPCLIYAWTPWASYMLWGQTSPLPRWPLPCGP